MQLRAMPKGPRYSKNRPLKIVRWRVMLGIPVTTCWILPQRQCLQLCWALTLGLRYFCWPFRPTDMLSSAPASWSRHEGSPGWTVPGNLVPDGPPLSGAIGRGSIPGNSQIETDVPRNPAGVASVTTFQNGDQGLARCKLPRRLSYRQPESLACRGLHHDRAVKIKESRHSIVHWIQGKIQRIT